MLTAINESKVAVNIIVSFIVATLLTGVSYLVGMKAGWITEINWLEVFSVFTSYSCTYLCVVQSRWNYPIGAISTAALTLLFFQSGLYSSAALNAYLVPTLIWGWFRWRPDHDTRPVTTVKNYWWIAYLGLTAIVWFVLNQVATYFGATLAAADSFILAGSILAQFLLDQKKLETWFFWAIVNVVAIVTYWNAGLTLVAFQFMFFLANTAYGYFMWKRTMYSEELKPQVT